MEDEQQWDDIGLLLDELEQLLMEVDDDSPHALQAQKILKKVRTCKAEWPFLGAVQGVGRPSGVFPQSGDERPFCEALEALLRAHGTSQKVNVPHIGPIPHSLFFALLYDACVQYGVASGVNDMKAYFDVIVPIAKRVLGEKDFTLGYPSLTRRTNEWTQYVPEPLSRVHLHRISLDVISHKGDRQKVSLLKFKLGFVTKLAQEFNILPTSPSKKVETK